MQHFIYFSKFLSCKSFKTQNQRNWNVFLIFASGILEDIICDVICFTVLCNSVTSYHKWPINQIYLTLNSSWKQLPRTLEKAVKLYILTPRRHAHTFKYAYFYAQISSCIIFLLTICLLTVSSEMIQLLCPWGKHWVRPACKCSRTHLGIH